MKKLLTVDKNMDNEQENIESKNSKSIKSIWMKNKKWIVIVASVVLVVLLVLVKLGIDTLRHPYHQSVTNIYEVESVLREENEIIVAVYEYKNIGIKPDSLNIGDWKLPLTEHKLQGFYEGQVIASYPTEKILIDVNPANRKIIIKLPENKEVILDSHINLDKTAWEVQNNILNPITVEEVSQFEYEVEQKELQAAIEKGLYKLAKENAEEFIKKLYVEFTEYELIFI